MSDGKKLNWDHGVLVDEGDPPSVNFVPVEGQPDQYSIVLHARHLRAESALWLAGPN